MAVIKISTAKSTSKQALKSVLRYVLNDDKTPDKEINVTGFFHGEITPDTVYKSFMKNKATWHKDTGRLYSHIIMSFHQDEKIEPYEVSNVAHEFCEKAYPGHQALIVVHQDKGHLHAHIILDSVSYENGKKIQTSKKDLQKQRHICDDICRSHGLSITQKGKNFYGEDRDQDDFTSWRKNTYRAIKSEPQDTPRNIDILKLLVAILDALIHARSIFDFIERLRRAMWKVTWTPERKHITFESMETGRKFRASNLQKTFESKFKYVFGEDFVLDKEHIENWVSTPIVDEKEELRISLQQRVEEAEKEAKKEIAAWEDKQLKKPKIPTKPKKQKKYEWEQDR